MIIEYALPEARNREVDINADFGAEGVGFGLYQRVEDRIRLVSVTENNRKTVQQEYTNVDNTFDAVQTDISTSLEFGKAGFNSIIGEIDTRYVRPIIQTADDSTRLKIYPRGHFPEIRENYIYTDTLEAALGSGQYALTGFDFDFEKLDDAIMDAQMDRNKELKKELVMKKAQTRHIERNKIINAFIKTSLGMDETKKFVIHTREGAHQSTVRYTTENPQNEFWSINDIKAAIGNYGLSIEHYGMNATDVEREVSR